MKRVILLISTTFILASCSILTSPTNKNPKSADSSNIANIPKHLTAKKFYKFFLNNYPEYQNLQTKFKLKYEENNSTKSLKGIIKNIKDSIIYISLYHSTGIPVAKILLTRDSILLNDRLNNKFYAKTYDFINSKYALNLTYNNIEALLFARPFIYGENYFEFKKFKDFKRYKDSTYYIFQSTKNRKIKRYYKKTKKGKKIKDRLINALTIQSFYINRKNVNLEKITIQDIYNGYMLETIYSDYSNTLNGKNFIKKMEIILKNKNNLTKFHIKFYKLSEKENLKIKFKRPDYDE